MQRHFVDDNHNLYVGWVLGIALNNGLDATPVLDDAGNYTDRLFISFRERLDDRITITVVVPPPPQDWSP